MRIKEIIRTLCLVFLLGAMPLSALAQKNLSKLVILHSSDTHSRVDPIEATASRNAGWGGISQRAAVIAKERQENPDLLLLDCGDISQGTAYYNLFQGEVEIQGMNLMGYDVMTIGNHEFDFGLDNMLRLFEMADFPVICANYDFSQTVLKDIVKPYTIIKRAGFRVGLIGISPPLEGLVQSSKCEGVVYLDPVESVNKSVSELRKQGVDVIILMSHLGVDTKMENKGDYDHNLIPQIQGVDLVLGGHTHTFMSKPLMVKDATGKEIPCMHIGNNGVYLSKSVLTMEADKKK